MPPRIFNLVHSNAPGKRIYRELAGTGIGDLLHSSEAFLPEAVLGESDDHHLPSSAW
jgi:hypothetical protein